MRTLATAVLTGLLVLAGVVSVSPAASADGTDRMRFALDEVPLATVVTAAADSSGSGNNARAVTAKGGVLNAVAGFAGLGQAVRYPKRCGPSSSCPRALLEVPDRADLDPGTARFSFGARLTMTSAETSAGANVLQKGYYDQAGGQWKLQVDGSAGKPSCVVSGVRNGKLVRAKVFSSVSVVDGAWHSVSCRRDADRLTVWVDGVERGRAYANLGSVANTAPVRAGGKDVTSSDNDQFNGVLDDLFLSVG